VIVMKDGVMLSDARQPPLVAQAAS
jgi:hypothetical protein